MHGAAATPFSKNWCCYTGISKRRDNRASSPHTYPLPCCHSTTLPTPTLPVLRTARSLTVAAVFAPEAHRTEAGVGPPADRAGAAVLAGVGVAEGVLGVAAWRYQRCLCQPRPCHPLPPARTRGTATPSPAPLPEGQTQPLSTAPAPYGRRQALAGGRGTGTCSGPVVGDVGGQVDAFAVDVQVSHAPHKVPVSDGEVLRQVGDPSEEQGTCEVQGPARREAQ